MEVLQFLKDLSSVELNPRFINSLCRCSKLYQLKKTRHSYLKLWVTIKAPKNNHHLLQWVSTTNVTKLEGLLFNKYSLWLKNNLNSKTGLSKNRSVTIHQAESSTKIQFHQGRWTSLLMTSWKVNTEEGHRWLCSRHNSKNLFLMHKHQLSNTEENKANTSSQDLCLITKLDNLASVFFLNTGQSYKWSKLHLGTLKLTPIPIRLITRTHIRLEDRSLTPLRDSHQTKENSTRWPSQVSLTRLTQSTLRMRKSHLWVIRPSNSSLPLTLADSSMKVKVRMAQRAAAKWFLVKGSKTRTRSRQHFHLKLIREHSYSPSTVSMTRESKVRHSKWIVWVTVKMQNGLLETPKLAESSLTSKNQTNPVTLDFLKTRIAFSALLKGPIDRSLKRTTLSGLP